MSYFVLIIPLSVCLNVSFSEIIRERERRDREMLYLPSMTHYFGFCLDDNFTYMFKFQTVLKHRYYNARNKYKRNIIMLSEYFKGRLTGNAIDNEICQTVKHRHNSAQLIPGFVEMHYDLDAVKTNAFSRNDDALCDSFIYFTFSLFQSYMYMYQNFLECFSNDNLLNLFSMSQTEKVNRRQVLLSLLTEWLYTVLGFLQFAKN